MKNRNTQEASPVCSELTRTWASCPNARITRSLSTRHVGLVASMVFIVVFSWFGGITAIDLSALYAAVWLLLPTASLLAISLVRMHPIHCPAHLHWPCATPRPAPPLLRGSARMDRTCAAQG